MKASHFPREYRAYNLDTKQMLYVRDLNTIGFTLAPDGLPSFREEPFNCVVMWNSGQKDKHKKFIYEGDICKLYINNEFGSLTQDYAVMRWSDEMRAFMLQIPMKGSTQLLNVVEVEKLGNEFENEELLPLI